ncbi:hypothetical protein CYMTET_29146 [Cymbomonas tetramitiformis]|uniref:Uncharacterized protein n=1 Tax=Cymbomonas tetramitiformis TaxID=36881 RepID=A0AAE0KVF7_9CHLO|nr:hypothetical protein CYMTET_29146 [Cymbomonas tetramitiformis]
MQPIPWSWIPRDTRGWATTLAGQRFLSPGARARKAASTGEEPPPPLNTGRDHPPKPQLISPPETPQPLWGEGIERIPGHAAGVTPPRSPSGGASKGAAVSEALQAISHITLLDPITLIEPMEGGLHDATEHVDADAPTPIQGSRGAALREGDAGSPKGRQPAHARAASMKNHFLHSLRRLHDDDDDSDA